MGIEIAPVPVEVWGLPMGRWEEALADLPDHRRSLNDVGVAEILAYLRATGGTAYDMEQPAGTTPDSFFPELSERDAQAV